MPFKTCEICLTGHFDDLPCPNCETNINIAGVEQAEPLGWITEETRKWVHDPNSRGPGMFTANRNGAGGTWAIYSGADYQRLHRIAKDLQEQCGRLQAIAITAKDLYDESEEYDFSDGMGRGALQQYWDALANALDPEFEDNSNDA